MSNLQSDLEKEYINQYLSSVKLLIQKKLLTPKYLESLLLENEEGVLKTVNSIIEIDSEKKFTEYFQVLVNHKLSYMFTKRLRLIASVLLDKSLISYSEYKLLFPTCAYEHLTTDYYGKFITEDKKEEAEEFARVYSRAKHGSLKDIKMLARYVVEVFKVELDKGNTSLANIFKSAQLNDEVIVLLVPGSRNIESASNLIFDIALKAINIFLANIGMPTIINVKLPRLDPPVENYASLSLAEREIISATQDHILPDINFYHNRKVHILFGDDVLITGATADKVKKQALMNGAISFHSLYAVVIDPVVVLKDPSIEEKLNTTAISGKLCKEIFSIFNQDDFIPVMKTYNIILSLNNHVDLILFLENIPLKNTMQIYIYAMGDGYLNHKKYKKHLHIVRSYLIEKNCLLQNGLIIEENI